MPVGLNDNVDQPGGPFGSLIDRARGDPEGRRTQTRGMVTSEYNRNRA
jgi:hypothetical protein